MPYSLSPPALARRSKTVTSWPSPRQGVGAGQAGRPGTDDGHPLAGGGCPGERLDAALEEPVGGVALEHADLDRLALLRRAHAGPLAQDLGRADPGAGAAHDVGLEDGERRTLDVVGLDAADEARDVDAGRAGLEAGRVVAEIAAAGLDQRLLAVQRRVQLVEVPARTPRRRGARPGCRPAAPTPASLRAASRRICRDSH